MTIEKIDCLFIEKPKFGIPSPMFDGEMTKQDCFAIQAEGLFGPAPIAIYIIRAQKSDAKFFREFADRLDAIPD